MLAKRYRRMKHCERFLNDLRTEMFRELRAYTHRDIACCPINHP